MDVKQYNEQAIEADKAMARELLAGGVGTLKALTELLKKDKAGFEAQVFEGRQTVMDPKIDELIAMRNYADRLIGRLQYYIEIDQLGTTPKGTPDSSK